MNDPILIDRALLALVLERAREYGPSDEGAERAMRLTAAALKGEKIETFLSVAYEYGEYQTWTGAPSEWPERVAEYDLTADCIYAWDLVRGGFLISDTSGVYDDVLEPMTEALAWLANEDAKSKNLPDSPRVVSCGHSTCAQVFIDTGIEECDGGEPLESTPVPEPAEEKTDSWVLSPQASCVIHLGRLSRIEGSDQIYTLTDDSARQGVTIRVRDLAVRVSVSGDGLVATIKHREGGQTKDSAYVPWDEDEDEDDDEERAHDRD